MKYIISVISLIFIILVYPKNFDIKKTSIIENAFSSSQYDNGLIITSKKNNEKFYSLYYSKILQKEKLDNPIKLKIKHRNRFFNISNGVYLTISNEFYFTANNQLGKLNLYKCQIKDLELIKPKVVKLFESENSVGHSTFSKDALKMIVSSEKSGDIDLILYTRNDYSSEWKFKRNLSELNSKNIELHPNLVNDSIIYFSRLDKKEKRMDLYSSILKNDNSWSDPKIYEHLNSSSDDYGVIFINEKSGYFTSNREGNDRIYYFEDNN
ncbi:hypothetical protein [Winogradskyella sp. Asnod2-B02-A]|uniref:hypothetical protein n=1 Tax=Winogradskyella sp. Asnod2-B02-A TaxID=3160583 RepID=UPI00386F414C